MAEHNCYGRVGEDAAAAYLVSQGYIIMARNWRIRRREIDIVCMKGDLLVVVEVKTRHVSEERPGELLDAAKCRNLRAAAEAYLKAKALRTEVRFDLILVTGEELTIEHIEDAIQIFD